MELLTASELAEVLKISRTRVVLMARRGDLPAVTVDGRLRFDVAEIEQWLKETRRGVEGVTT